jgi:hypothetical protein
MDSFTNTGRVQGQAQGEWAATVAFLSTKAPGPTRYPGATAWLQRLLRQYCKLATTSSRDEEECTKILDPVQGVPPITELTNYLSLPAASESSGRPVPTQLPKLVGRLCVSEFVLNEHRYAVTRPIREGECPMEGYDLVEWAVAELDARRPPQPRLPFDRLATSPHNVYT